MSDYGILSIVPPVLAIFLAFKTKNVILSLFSSIVVGVLIYAGGNPYVAVVEAWKSFIFKQISAPWNAELAVLMTIIGGFVALIERSKSVESLAKNISRLIGNRLKVQLAAWVGGMLLFFSDSANCLILGPVFRPLADRFKVSREKLAYIVDSTASPVCMIVPISTWAILIGGIISGALKEHGMEIDILSAYAQTLPYQYYTILAVLLVPVVALTKREFGPMLAAESKAVSGELRYADQDEDDSGALQKEAPASIAVISLGVLFVVLFGMFLSFGFPGEMESANVRISLATAYFLAMIVCMMLLVGRRVMTLEQTIQCAIEGAQRMAYVVIIFIVALSLGSICSALGTGKFMARVSVSYIPPMLVPAIVFFLGAVISFATGTANGTQALLIPLAIPLAIHANAPLFVTIAAAATGGLFGDHCSPISDTTILASMGSGCEVIEHARTQIPYALVAAAVSFVMFIVSSLIRSGIVLMVAAAVAMAAMYVAIGRVFGKEVAA